MKVVTQKYSQISHTYQFSSIILLNSAWQICSRFHIFTSLELKTIYFAPLKVICLWPPKISRSREDFDFVSLGRVLSFIAFPFNCIQGYK